MESGTYQILQLTDMHLFADPERKLLGVNTQDSFESVFNLASQLHPSPDMLCLSGDISQDETVQAYERFAARISAYHCPKYWIPGNHDDPELIEAIFPQYHIQKEKHIVLDHWQIIMLDTKKYDAVEGILQADQFELLEHALASHPEHHTLIFMHHHPLTIGSRWLDRLMLMNASRFWEAISVYNNIRAVICGHVHQEHHAQHGTIEFYSSPSTCFQFKPQSDKFALDIAMPGYRQIALNRDGSFTTSVHRVTNFILELDDSIGGY